MSKTYREARDAASAPEGPRMTKQKKRPTAAQEQAAALAAALERAKAMDAAQLQILRTAYARAEKERDEARAERDALRDALEAYEGRTCAAQPHCRCLADDAGELDREASCECDTRGDECPGCGERIVTVRQYEQDEAARRLARAERERDEARRLESALHAELGAAARELEARRAWASRWKSAARALRRDGDGLLGRVAQPRASRLLRAVAPLVLRVVDYQADADDCYLCGRLADGRHAAHCDLAGWTSAQVSAVRAALDPYASAVQGCTGGAAVHVHETAARSFSAAGLAVAAGRQRAGERADGEDCGGAERRRAEATEDAGKHGAMGAPPPPHGLARSKGDAVMGDVEVGHEGHKPRGHEAAENTANAEGAKLRGSSLAVFADPEPLNAAPGEGPSAGTGEEHGAGVQGAGEQAGAGSRDGTLVQDCTRLAIGVARDVAELIRLHRADARAEAEAACARAIDEVTRRVLPQRDKAERERDEARDELERARAEVRRLGALLQEEREKADVGQNNEVRLDREAEKRAKQRASKTTKGGRS